MATRRGEYTTVEEVRTEYLDIAGNSDDATMLKFIRSVSREIDSHAGWFFYPFIETRYFDVGVGARGNSLYFDAPLLAVTTLTNGDTNVITSTQYVFSPRNPNDSPKWKLQLLTSAGVNWEYGDDPQNAVTLLGVWGYHEHYDDAWQNVGTIGTAAGINSSVTTFDLTAGHSVKAGQLLKCETEFIYVGTRDGDTVSDLVRGVNGSTAASHATASALEAWTVDERLAQLARVASAMRYHERQHPGTDQFTLATGETIVVPKDIGKWIEKEVGRLGLQRLGVG